MELVVSACRHVICQYGSGGRIAQRFAYGIQTYTRTDAEVRHMPHRDRYSDADAQAVCDWLNHRAGA